MNIPDGDPIPMSEFTLGEKYTSEDMYRDYPDLRRGDRVAVEKDGVVFTDTVQAVTYSSAEPAIWPRLSVWQRIMRRLTPKSRRRPLNPTRPYKPSQVTVQVGSAADTPLQRHQKSLEDIQRMLGGFTRG